MRKRGYFFTLDVLIAMIVLVVGFVVIWTSAASKPQLIQPYFLSQDLIDYLSQTTVAEMTGKSYVSELVNNGNISVSEIESVTLLEQMAIFYYKNSTSSPAERVKYYHLLNNFTKVVLENSIPHQYSFEFILKEESTGFYNYTQHNPLNKLQEDSDSLVSSKTIVAVIVDKTEISPPYLAEVRVWQ